MMVYKDMFQFLLNNFVC